MTRTHTDTRSSTATEVLRYRARAAAYREFVRGADPQVERSGTRISASVADPMALSTVTATLEAGMWRWEREKKATAVDWDLRQWSAPRERLPVVTPQPHTVPEPAPPRTSRDLIASLEESGAVPFAKTLADRLRDLTKISREEAPDQAPLDTASLEGMLAFLTKNPDLVSPSVVLTPEGHLRGRWRRDRSHYFAVEFLDAENVRFVLFAPNPRHPYKTCRIFGDATVDSLMELVAPYRVQRWTSTRLAEAA